MVGAFGSMPFDGTVYPLTARQVAVARLLG